ncbi:hypothetical protein HDF17_000112 [Granulicella arctica]|uniref:Uncharacterized protein n=1 Tax=Granulicella arctica TaxID=940613 RepID=A0A7Y9PDB2_9BACT|nr:hypothetical protein [Granulicella arctica]
MCLLQITGAPKRFGHVYMGTHGRRIFDDDPSLTLVASGLLGCIASRGIFLVQGQA